MPYRSIYIDAIRDKQRGQPTHNFSVYLASPINISRQGISRIRVVASSIENTTYSFKYTNNVFYYYTDVGTGAEALNYITLPIDKYIGVVSDTDNDPNNDLIGIFDGLFSSAGHNITTQFNDNTGKLTFTNNTGGSVRFVSSDEYEYNPNLYTNKCNMKIGLTTDVSNNIITDGSSFTCDSIVRLKKSALYITSSLTYDNALVGNELINYQKPIIARMPVSDPSFGATQYYQNTLDSDEIALFGDSISNIKFTVYDEDLDIPLDLNGGNVNLQLEVSY